jgi:UPF0271 protein
VHRNRSIDLSADVGELAGEVGRRVDAALIERVSTAHLATGGHAGDEASMRLGAQACAAASTRLGAHPSYPDRAGFGRRRLSLDPRAVVASLVAQLEALSEAAAPFGLTVESIKPHGQLYHDLGEDDVLADAVFDALRSRPGAPVVVLAAGSRAAERAAARGLVVVAEGFCDRAYDRAGSLRARTEPGAVLAEPELAARQALELALRGLGVGAGRVAVDSLCVHSDGPGATEVLDAVLVALAGAAIAVSAPDR